MIRKNKFTIKDIKAKLNSEINRLSPADALKLLFEIDALTYELEGIKAREYGNGTHTKHKHINYHKFFTDNIKKGNNVLDIGSSYGELVLDIASKASPGKVVGVEIEEDKVKIANSKKLPANLSIVLGDATENLPEEHFDVVTLSNVLEHIEDRVELLKEIVKKYSPKKVIIRVPAFDRDWRVPLKKELGIDYRLDDTHYVEYTQEGFEEEMKKAGLVLKNKTVNWGEIWAVLEPV